VASEGALSAAYAIASTADRFWVTRTGELGSIGVVAAHLDESGADAQAGHRWSFVHAGARKVDGNRTSRSPTVPGPRSRPMSTGSTSSW
jgi:ClpP class serine protease